MMEKEQILKVIVGSQAHGLAGPDSDFDYRGVFVVPTSKILSLGGNIKNTHWIEGKDDDTAWEIGHFLNMATHCNPTILETFLAPRIERALMIDPETYEEFDLVGDLGDQLRDLFPYVWNPTDVMNAFIGYGVNQRAKFFKNQDNRAPKYAAAYLRVLYNAWQLLATGTFSVSLIDSPVYEHVKAFKEGNYEVGDVIQQCWEWESKVIKAHKSCKQKPDLDKVNEFLLRVRREMW